MQLANSVIQQAVEQNDGKNLAEALDHRDTIRDNLKELTDAKQYLSTNPQRGSPAAQQQPLDPRHVAHAQSFMVDNSWWDPQGRDQDSILHPKITGTSCVLVPKKQYRAGSILELVPKEGTEQVNLPTVVLSSELVGASVR